MKVTIYSIFLLFIYLSTATSKVIEIDCLRNTNTVAPIVNYRAVTSLLAPVKNSIDAESVIDLIYSYYDEEDLSKQEVLLAQIQSLFDTATVNPNSVDFDGGSILFNIGLMTKDLDKEKVFNIVTAIMNYTGEEAVNLNLIDPDWKSSVIHQSSLGLNGKVTAAFLTYKKEKGFAADPYVLDRTLSLSFLGSLPTPIMRNDYQEYRDFFEEIHKVAPELLNFPLIKDGSVTFFPQVRSAAQVETLIHGTTSIRDGLQLPLKALGMNEYADKVASDKWK